MKERRGFFTSEFFVVVLNSVVAIAIAGGYLSLEGGETVVNTGVDIINAIVHLVEVLAPVIGTAYYVWSRTKVKTT